MRSLLKDDAPLTRLVTHLLSEQTERNGQSQEKHYNSSQCSERIDIADLGDPRHHTVEKAESLHKQTISRTLQQPR